MFVRLFVDENLDRMVPISRQPREKVQAIIGKAKASALSILSNHLKPCFNAAVSCFASPARFVREAVPGARREGAQAHPHLLEVVPAAQAAEGRRLGGARRARPPARDQSTHAAASDVGRRRADPRPGVREREPERETPAPRPRAHQSADAVDGRASGARH